MLAGLVLAGPAEAASVVTAVVTDPLSGVAIDGFDPVTYFTETVPQLGSPQFEYEWSGVPWYFANAANRDVFMRAPEVYAPAYGGHCTMSMARGFLSEGKPGIYVVHEHRLYLFYSIANREAFVMSEGEALGASAHNWPILSKDLSTGQ